MTKQERLKTLSNKIQKHQNKLYELQVERKAVMNETERWRAPEGDKYYYVDGDGIAECRRETLSDMDVMLFDTGNYHQTEAQAMLGPEYFHANSEYTYWHQDMPKPRGMPEGCQVYGGTCGNREWKGDTITSSAWGNASRRWPKTSSVEWVKL